MQQSRRFDAVAFAIFAAVLTAAPAAQADPPPHGGGFSHFVDTTNYQPCNSDAACTAAGVKYLKSIGVLDQATGQPTGQRKSLNDWKNFVGFNAKVSVATARAYYFNKNELAFGRDANCVLRQIGVQPAMTTVACYISNYSDAAAGWPGGNPQASIQMAKNHTVPPLFTVTMEVHFMTGLGLPSSGRPAVTFIAYGPDGAPLPAMAFDHEGKKPLPGVCVACHAAWFDSGTQTVQGGSFLPFDSPAFIHEASRQLLGQPPIRIGVDPQHEAFRALNTMVVASQPVQPVTDLIDGWYKHCGGVYQTNCTIDDEFVPSANCTGNSNGLGETCGWTVANDSLNIKALYQQVIRPYCRNCHLVYYGALNVQSYKAFLASAQQVHDEVYANLYNMPFAEVPYYLFWNNSPSSTLSQQLKAYLTAVGAGP